jgi:hypothetical protein
MKRFAAALTLAAALLPFSASAAPTGQGYDKAAVSAASIALEKAQEGCKAQLAAKEIQSYSGFAACSLVAERIFFSDINFKKMDVFEAYAASYQALAADRDAGRVSEKEAGHRVHTILSRFYRNCNCTSQRGGWSTMAGPAVAGGQYDQGGGFVSSTGLPAQNPFP